MGTEMIKDDKGKAHLALSDEDFYNDDIMGDKFDDYDILEFGDEKKKNFLKVRSKFNSKVYAMKKINSVYISKVSKEDISKEFENLKKLDNLNVTKYYKYFFENNNLYIIYEYVDNNDINTFIEGYKSFNRPIETNTLWNIFMQCISALKYIHSQKIIHNNIKLENVFMTENKTIKLGDFRFSFLAKNSLLNRLKTYHSPEMLNNLHFDEKTDIYAMGVVFHYLCYFSFPNKSGNKENKDVYPKEMEDIIQLMLKKEDERPDINNLYDMIMKEYIKNVAKITSIDSVFRCMYSFMNFSKNMKDRAQSFLNPEKTPISFNYVNCIQNYSAENPKENAIFLNNFRNLLYQNGQINNEIEIKPSVVINFLLEKLNKETGNNFNGPSLGIQPINFDTNKSKSYSKFMSYYNNNFSSLISQYFVGFIKTKRICLICNMGFYSFNLFPYIEFDLNRCKNYNFNVWFYKQNNTNITLEKDHKYVCQECKCITDFYEFKQFFHIPKNFIISLYPGEVFKNENNIDIPMELDLTNSIEDNNAPKNFNLVGIIKRMTDDKGAEYYIAIYLDPYQKCWYVSEKNNLTKINNPKDHNKGFTLVLFYSAKINII